MGYGGNELAEFVAKDANGTIRVECGEVLSEVVVSEVDPFSGNGRLEAVYKFVSRGLVECSLELVWEAVIPKQRESLIDEFVLKFSEAAFES